MIPCGETDGADGPELGSPYGGSFGGWATGPGLAAADHEALLDATIAWARERGFRALLVSSRPAPYRIHGEGAEFALASRGGTVIARDVTHVAPLAGTESDVRGRIRGTSRRGARKAEKLGTTTRLGDAEDLAGFHALLAEDRARFGALPTHTAEELEDIRARRPGDLHLVLAENGGRLVGGSLLFRATGRVALGFYSARAAVPEAERCMNLVTERALVEMHARGYEWLDFGTSSVGGELNAGLSEFKEGFGGMPFVRETWRVEIR